MQFHAECHQNTLLSSNYIYLFYMKIFLINLILVAGKTKEKYMDLMLFLGNYVMVLLVINGD